MAALKRELLGLIFTIMLNPGEYTKRKVETKALIALPKLSRYQVLPLDP